MLLILNTVHRIFNLAVHNRACLDIVSLPYCTGNNMWHCYAWVSNHCFINIAINIYTKTHRHTETKMFFPFMCKTKVSASVVIIFDCVHSLSVVSFVFLLHSSSLTQLHSTLFGLISPLLHYFLLLSFLPFSSLFSSSPISSSLPGPLWQIPLLFFHP